MLTQKLALSPLECKCEVKASTGWQDLDMAARSYRPPREWLVADGKWPTGPFTPGAPPYVMVTAGVDATSFGLTGLPGDSQKCDG